MATDSDINKAMASQTQIQAVLDDDLWASRILTGEHSQIKVHLITFPGVIGGIFRAQIVDLEANCFGQVNISLSSTGVESNNLGGEFSSHSHAINFQEIESLLVEDFSFEVLFRIPYEVQGTEEGAIWHLSIHFENGVTEIFQIPICRTPESNPEITSVRIAADGPEQKKYQQKKPPQNLGNNIFKSYIRMNSNGELNLRFPARTPGRSPVLVKGLAIFAGLWTAVLAIFYWVSNGAIEPILMLGLPLLVMLMYLTFMLFGVSHCKITRENLITTHKLLGIPLNWRKANRVDFIGFTTICLGMTSSPAQSQLSYMVIAKTKKFANVFLCLTIFNQNEARILARQLNEYWEIGKP